ncbi:MAG: DUF2169 domain-containing protein [Phycisphaerales bacterium]
MELTNATRMVAGYTLGMDPDGRESAVVAIKGTFTLPTDGSEPELAEEQVELVMADEFTGDPGFSATIYESDYAPEKPYCDVLLNGSAYAPDGRPAKTVTVEFFFAGRSKRFDVHGDRVWDKVLLSFAPSEPQPFLSKPISYDNAFGGSDADPDNPEKSEAFPANPIGRGYYPLTRGKALLGKPLPDTSETGKPVDHRVGDFKPMSFGPIGRVFPPRPSFAGTYDDDWLNNTFPFLPADFDPRYFQCAPLDQQFPHPKGGEEVVLTNLTPQGRTAFRLPTIDLPVEFTDASYEHTEVQAVLDTIVIEPDLGRFTLTWRASHPLKRNMLEMRQCVIGRMSRAWYRARDTGKTYYPSLGALVAARGGVEEDEG